MKLLFLALFVLLSLSSPLSAQILNLDRTIYGDSSSMKKKVRIDGVIGASYYSYQQTSSFVNEALNYDFNYYAPKNYILVLSGKYNVTTAGGVIFQNMGYAHLRFRDNDTRRFSPEPFAQYQWNNTIGLIQRSLIGCNLRIRLLENAKADIYYGVGMMLESEEWDYDGVTDPNLLPANTDNINNLFYKTNQYIKCSFSVNRNCDLVTAFFFQNKVDDFTNTFRISNYTTMNIAISRKFTFAITSEYSYDNNPVVPIKQNLYTIISTINLKF